jgi:hypothetical protein
VQFFGPRKQYGIRESFKESLVKYMERVEDRRVTEVYEHKVCTEACKTRGCGRLYVADGCWKLHYPICMFTNKPVDKYVPHVCTKSPMNSKAFCVDHSSVVEKLVLPTGLRPFIKSCGADPANYSKEEKKKVEEKLKKLCGREVSKSSVPEVQGTRSLYDNADLQVRVYRILNYDTSERNIKLGLL